MKILGFGDFLIHFSPIANERFLQADTMKISFTGAEANAILALSLWGKETAFVTRLPENDLAKRGIMFINSFGTDTSLIARGGKRMGAYYLENGASLRPSAVIYDRENSAFCEAYKSDFDFDKMLLDTSLLYISGITPALSENLFDCTLALCKEAKKRGIEIAFDINYRSALEDYAKAKNILSALSPYITLLISNEEHLKNILGISSKFSEYSKKDRLFDIAMQTKNALSINKIAITVRRTLSASDNIIYSAFLCGDEFALSDEYKIHIVDRVGSGDAFSAGLIFGLTEGLSNKEALDFAAASCALKHTVANDINFVSKEEIFRLMQTKSADVKR